MAFKLNFNDPLMELPASDHGIYLFPVGWFMYGYAKKYITITEPRRFNNSLQGSAIQAYRESIVQRDTNQTLERDLTPDEIYSLFGNKWLMAEGGSSELKVLTPLPKTMVAETKIGVLFVRSLSEISIMSLKEQESINQQYITCFAGCGCTLKAKKAWFVSADRLKII